MVDFFKKMTFSLFLKVSDGSDSLFSKNIFWGLKMRNIKCYLS